MNIQMITIEFFMRSFYYAVHSDQDFESEDKILKCDHSSESY